MPFGHFHLILLFVKTFNQLESGSRCSQASLTHRCDVHVANAKHKLHGRRDATDARVPRWASDQRPRHRGVFGEHPSIGRGHDAAS